MVLLIWNLKQGINSNSSLNVKGGKDFLDCNVPSLRIVHKRCQRVELDSPHSNLQVTRLVTEPKNQFVMKQSNIYRPIGFNGKENMSEIYLSFIDFSIIT